MNNSSAPFLLQLGILTKRLLLRLARRPLAELPNIIISAFFLLVYDGHSEGFLEEVLQELLLILQKEF